MAERATNLNTTQGESSDQLGSARFATVCGRIGDKLILEDASTGTFEAMTTVTLSSDELNEIIEHRKQAVVLWCEQRAVVTGFVQQLPLSQQTTNSNEEPLVFNAPAGITLRCGEASVRLMPNGRVILRGDTVVSRAKSKSHIIGASVRIN